MHIVYLILGSNLGDRNAILGKAVSLINSKIGEVILKSKIYETAPWGGVEQPAYLNQVLMVKTTLSPEIILKDVLEIEKDLGRERVVKWGARSLDIDILFYDDIIINTDDLKIPHPFIHQRKFVLVPLVEIAPNFVHPLFKTTSEDLLNKLSDCSEVKAIDASAL
jgi:2-amino-4-hydroxy-6-hydroxymethyldihydropteridine diphosphokinase